MRRSKSSLEGESHLESFTSLEAQRNSIFIEITLASSLNYTIYQDTT